MAKFKRSGCPFVKSTYCGMEKCQFWNDNFNRCLLALSAEKFLDIELIPEEPLPEQPIYIQTDYDYNYDYDYEEEEEEEDEEKYSLLSSIRDFLRN